MAVHNVIGPPKQVKVTFSLEPAYNGIGSLSLFGLMDALSGLGEWVYQTAGRLTSEQHHTNDLVLRESELFLADAAWSGFPEWVDSLAMQDSTTMRDAALQRRIKQMGQPGKTYDPTQLLENRIAYLSLIEDYYRRLGRTEDIAIWAEIHSLLNNPAAMQETIVSHLQLMWETLLADEWARNLPMLEESIAAFESLNLQGLTAIEATRLVVGRDPQEKSYVLDGSWLAEADEIIFIPCAHNGPYIVQLVSLDASVARITFGPRIPEGASVRAPALSHSELLIRLQGLAEDTRLRIVALLAQKGELNTPEIMANLNLTQSTASRHLQQLLATGYLDARRHEGANLYRLNPRQIENTCQALKRICG